MEGSFRLREQERREENLNWPRMPVCVSRQPPSYSESVEKHPHYWVAPRYILPSELSEGIAKATRAFVPTD